MDEKEHPIILPPRFVFEDDGLYVGTQNAHPEDPNVKNLPVAIGVEFPKDGGILMHMENCKYPKKGWPFRDALLTIDALKRFIISSIRFVLAFPKNLFTGNVIRSAMEQYSDFSFVIIKEHGTYWKPQYYCTMVREMYRVAIEMATDEVETRFVKALCTIFEFDDAYRWFVQDGLAIMDLKAFLKNPSKEIRRVLLVMASRGEGTREKFEKFANFFWLVLKIPVIQRTVLTFFSKVDMEKLYLSEDDWYWCLVWNGYDFGGKSLPYRRSYRESVDAKWVEEGMKHIDAEGNEIIIKKNDDTG